jgi:ribonuclease D
MDKPQLATPAEIERAAAGARQSGRLGIDTEFISEGRYRPLLCLVQVAVADPGCSGDGTTIAVIDALADAAAVTPVAALLADPTIEVILHAGRQDVAILRRVWQTEVSNIFDTQVAAGFVGQSAQSGYGNLIGAMLGRRLAKTASYTRWDIRPLSAEQLRYAVEDVADLLHLADRLKDRLRRAGRLEWAAEECRRLEAATDERDPEAVWIRLPRVSQLDPRSRAVSRALAAWRERTAAREDRPVGSVLADQVLVEVARRRPTTRDELARIRGVHRSVLGRRGPEILAAVERGIHDPPIPRERSQFRSEPADGPVIALAEAWLRARALEVGLAYELLSSRAELEAVVSAARRGEPEPPVRALTGWRGQLVGAELRNLVAGRTAIAVDGQLRLRLVEAPG